MGKICLILSCVVYIPSSVKIKYSNNGVAMAAKGCPVKFPMKCKHCPLSFQDRMARCSWYRNLRDRYRSINPKGWHSEFFNLS